jgi:hypothetical protein
MPTFQLKQSADKKEYKWSLVDPSIPNEIKIVTWKGTYSIDYPQPTCFYDNTKKCSSRGDISKYTFKTSLWCEDFHVMLPFLWHDGFCFQMEQYFWHPLKKKWVENWKHFIKAIFEDILQWLLQQSPQEKQMRKAYLEDRVLVESTFEAFVSPQALQEESSNSGNPQLAQSTNSAINESRTDSRTLTSNIPLNMAL